MCCDSNILRMTQQILQLVQLKVQTQVWSKHCKSWVTTSATCRHCLMRCQKWNIRSEFEHMLCFLWPGFHASKNHSAAAVLSEFLMKKAEFERETKSRELDLKEREMTKKWEFKNHKLALQEAQLQLAKNASTSTATSAAGAGGDMYVEAGGVQARHKVIERVIDGEMFTYHDQQWFSDLLRHMDECCRFVFCSITKVVHVSCLLMPMHLLRHMSYKPWSTAPFSVCFIAQNKKYLFMTAGISPVRVVAVQNMTISCFHTR